MAIFGGVLARFSIDFQRNLSRQFLSKIFGSNGKNSLMVHSISIDHSLDGWKVKIHSEIANSFANPGLVASNF